MKNIEKFKIIQGRKSPDDKILLFNNVAVAFEDVSACLLYTSDAADE